MKKVPAITFILLISFQCYSQKKHKISGTLYYTSASYGGIERDNSHLPLLPLKEFKLYVVQVISADSIPTVVKSFKTNKKGEFSISLPSGKYGFVTEEEIKGGLTKGQFLPRKMETHQGTNGNVSEWECNRTCPLQLNTNSIQQLVIINHCSSFCMNCQ